MKKTFLSFLLCSVIIQIFAQQDQSLINPRFLREYWDADWITHPSANLKEYVVYHFRKSFDLATKPEKFLIHVSADNRYRLFVNGQAVCFGPARGDLRHWYFETIDIASFLKPGKNLLAAVVLGMISGIFGGVIRDTLLNEIPLIFRKEMYATPCLLGSTLFVVLYVLDTNTNINFISCVIFIVLFRYLAVRYAWSLPRLTFKE